MMLIATLEGRGSPHKAWREAAASSVARFCNSLIFNAIYFRDDRTNNTIFELLISRAIQNISDMIGYLY